MIFVHCLWLDRSTSYLGSLPLQTNSITEVRIVEPGSGYVSGELQVLSSPGAGFLGSFVASNETGGIIR
jgi:hypothetical protein